MYSYMESKPNNAENNNIIFKKEKYRRYGLNN
jgi:hypothetical protein